MGSWKLFLATFLLSCVVIEVSSINFGSLFGTTRTELRPSESEEELHEEDKKIIKTKPFKIPKPIIAKPILINKFKKPIKPLILATKTVYVEVTSRITTHPMCLAVHGVPPCLPFTSPNIYHVKENEKADLNPESFIEPSATYDIVEPTRILDGVSFSEDGEELESAEVPIEEEELDRSGRYLELAMPTPFFRAKPTGEINEEPTEQNARLVDKLFHKGPIKHFLTKTLWVTKVEKFLDYRVTATLEAKNCVPVDLQLPLCSPLHQSYTPGQVPNLGVGIDGGLFRPEPLKPFINQPTVLTPKPHFPLLHFNSQVKPVHKPGYIQRDDIKETEKTDKPIESAVGKEETVKDE